MDDKEKLCEISGWITVIHMMSPSVHINVVLEKIDKILEDKPQEKQS